MASWVGKPRPASSESVAEAVRVDLSDELTKMAWKSVVPGISSVAAKWTATVASASLASIPDFAKLAAVSAEALRFLT
jgi:hypothetical protein